MSTIQQLTLAAVCVLATSCTIFEPTLGENQARAEHQITARSELAVSLPAAAAESPSSTQLSAQTRRVPEVSAAKSLVLPASLRDDTTFHLELREKSISEAIHMIAEFAGVNIYLDPSLTRTIDASFPNVRLQDALSIILSQNELELIEDPPGIYWVVSNDSRSMDRAMFRTQSVSLAGVTPLLQSMVGAGTSVIVDPAQNLIVVNGVRSDIHLIEEYLRAADRPKRQVLIEARLVEVMLGESFELGVAAALDNRSLNGNPISLLQQFTTPDQSFSFDFSTADGDLTSTIQALQQYVGIELISSPRIAATNNSEANIEIITEVPYIQTTNTTSTTTGTAGTSSFQEVQFKESGVKLKVVPSIQEDGVIEMRVEQELSEVVDFFSGIPVLDTRSISSTLQVKDRHTLMIGGLMQDSVRKTDRGIPLLMDLPIIGRFFKSDEDSKDKRELVLFLTPTIMEVGAAEGVTNAFREVYRSRRAEMGMQGLGGEGEVNR